MSKHIPDVIGGCGLASLVIGTAMWSAAAAFIVAGVALLGIAYLAARREREVRT